MMTKAFVDSESVHAALSALLIGRDRLANTPWEQQSLLEVTYLLMHANVHMIPGPAPYSGPSGPYQHVLAQFPQLEEDLPIDRRKAMAWAKAWATRSVSHLRKQLQDLQANTVAQAYAGNQVECFWLHHVQMYGSLFNREFVPQCALVLGCSETDLLKIRARTADPALVQRWIHDGRKSEDAKLAECAYWLAVLLRGRLHQHLAKASGLQLVAHPFRRAVQLQLPEGPGKPVLRSEELFAKMIIGAALLNGKPQQRVLSWVAAVREARQAVLSGAVALPQTVLETQAETYAIAAARKLGVAGHWRVLARAIDVTASVGFPVLAAITVSPWLTPLGPIAAQTYRYLTGTSFGDELAKVARSTRAHFRGLGNLVPGRIERHLRTG